VASKFGSTKLKAMNNRYYRCVKHKDQVWEYGPGDDEWTWRGQAI
jgi:hypothetical protein